MTEKRIEALQLIVNSKVKDVDHLKAEIRCHKDIIAMKNWWPHYKWLKANNVPIASWEEQKKFSRMLSLWKVNQRTTEVNVSRQTVEMARQIAEVRIIEIRKSNAQIRE